MKVDAITSNTNPLLKKIRSLHQRSFREKYAAYILEGERLLEEALLKGVELEEIIASETFFKQGLGRLSDANLARLLTVPDKIFAELATTTNPSGILAIAKIKTVNPKKLFSGTPLVVIADAIQDPGNLGTLIRTSLAASASGLIMTKGTVDPYNPKVVRSAMGASFQLPCLWDMDTNEAIKLCRDNGLQVVASAAEGTKYFWQANMTKPTAIIVGNEGQGLSQNVLDAADEIIAIPMSDKSESLNAAQAATIFLFEAVRQRHQY
ncbi:MAG: RNA methyltransferase [Candidatus Obscuribacterales bacterium]|nr:RNA methyltransferase [Candidatus Obscuribacterales bacterium]